MVRRISEREILCQTLWLNYEVENARDLGGWANLLGCKEVSSAVAYTSSVLVIRILLAGERDHSMWKRELRTVRVND